MKKIILILIFAITLTGMAYGQNAATPQIIVSGEAIHFDDASGSPFVDETGRIQVPVRAFAESINANVNWDIASQTVFINKSQTIVIIPLGKNYYEVDGKRSYMDTVSRVKGGRTYLPLRYIAEAVGFGVTWNASTGTATVAYSDNGKIAVSDDDVPKNKYKVLYYQTDHPGKIINTDFSDYIGVNSGGEYQGIAASNFSAIWIGDFDFAEDTEKTIDVAISWADYSLKIDGKPVYSDTYLFKKGTHRIEVNYSNNWHTIGFQLQFNDQVETATITDVKRMMGPLVSRGVEQEYVGVYESAENDHSTVLELTKKSKPVVLFLSSYSPVNWKIMNPDHVEIKAVFFNSYESGGTVSFDNGAPAPVYRMPELVMAFTVFPSYSEVGHGYHFSDEEFGSLRTQIEEISGKPLSGFTGEYASSVLSVPGMVLDQPAWKTIDEAYLKINQLKNLEPIKPSTLFGKSISGTVETWGKHLSSEPVPLNRFRAYYINTDSPKNIIKTEIVESAGIKYAWSDFLGIPSEDFGVYYVGDFTFDKDTARQISLAQQVSFTRLIIDGKVIFDETENNWGTVPYTFTKGTHRIEVEHINNWHTVGFSTTLDSLPISDSGSIRRLIEKYKTTDTTVHYVGLHESSRIDQKVHLSLNGRDESAILILNSMEPIHWVINGPERTKLKAIILTSYFDGSTVTFSGAQRCEVLRGANTYVDTPSVDSTVTSLPQSSASYQDILRFVSQYGLKRFDGATLDYADDEATVGRIAFQP